MERERWQRIEELYHTAILKDPAQRPSFLDQACAGDELLRKEVESLIGFSEKGSFLESPALHVAAELLTPGRAGSLIDKTLGSYRILSLLGAGGMGEVYLAQDARLGRKIALKLLPPHLARDQARLRRFEQEARAASALNHPNILTIFEIGLSGQIPFIATEFIEGQTLRERMSAGRLDLKDALEIALQATNALAAAHQAGIVHRDIKPENIMVRRDGLVKLLDFGLAKLLEPQAAPLLSSGAAPHGKHTEPGSVMGTVSYMSPEQLRGMEVDARSDIFSLGVVLYEVLSGSLPFPGMTTADKIASILHRQPQPLQELDPAISKELEWVAAKSLAKDREERYQHVKDLYLDIKRIKQRLEFKAELERSVGSDPGRRPTSVAPEASDRHLADASVKPTTPPSSRRWLLWVATAVPALAGTILLLAWLSGGIGSEGGRKVLFSTTSMQKLTTTGKTPVVSISRDSRYIAYVLEESEGSSLWLHQLASASNLQIVPPAAQEYLGLTFSPDGDYVYYATWKPNAADAILYRVPVLGGNPKVVLGAVGSPVSFSPDGAQFAYADSSTAARESFLKIAMADGSATRTLTTRRYPEYFDEFGNGPAWSPDGRMIAVLAGNSGRYGLSRDVVVVKVSDGKEMRVGALRWCDFGGIAWAHDGTGMVISANDRIFSGRQLWFLRYPGGDASRVTNDLDDYRGVTLTGDSRVIATAQIAESATLWVITDGLADQARQITSEVSRSSGMEGLSWTPQGKIVHRYPSGGTENIWTMDPDGRNRRQLTADSGNNIHPSASPDGRHIVFVSDREGRLSIWRMDKDGSNPLRLTDGSSDVFPSCSPDGRWVVFQRGYRFDASRTIWKVSMGGGEATEFSKRTSRGPVFSPDGDKIAFFEIDQRQWKIAVTRFPDGSRLRSFDLPGTVRSRVLRWTRDARSLAYIDDRGGMSNIWLQPLDGGPARQLTAFNSNFIFDFDWSFDGRQLALSRGTVNSDVVLIRDTGSNRRE